MRTSLIWTIAVITAAFLGVLWAMPQVRPAFVEPVFSTLGAPSAIMVSNEPATGSAREAAKSAAPGKTGAGKGGGNVAVESRTARAGKSTADVRAVGSLRSDESVQIATEIAGRIASINFKEGETVQQGDLLLKLDDALARAEVDDAAARFSLAQSNFDRAKALSRTGNVTEKAQDEATANLETARAAMELGRVRLSKHEIKAPFSGIVGIRKASPGAYLAIGTPIVNLEKIDTIKADFKLPELYLANIKVGQVIELTVDAIPNRTFAGEIYAIDPQVDVNGRALAIRARIANPDMVLRPGLFARIVVKGREQRDVVLVPESALVPRGGDTFVYRIVDGKAEEVKVKLGDRRNAEVEILEGLTAETKVVTAGQQKLRNGASVDVIEPPLKKQS